MQVLIVDSDPASHDLLATLLLQVFGAVAIQWDLNLETAFTTARRQQRPDLVVLDVALPGRPGIEALTSFRNKVPESRIVVFSARNDRASILAALASGAAGYILKDYSPRLTKAALRVVAAGGTYVPQGALPANIRVPVTPRKRDVLRLLLDGYSNERIAKQLAISESTVKQHVRALFDAVGVSTRAQLIATAARRGIHGAMTDER